jgi:hypothetical protein
MVAAAVLLLLLVVSRYIVDRGDQELWDKVLADENTTRRQLIDQVCFASSYKVWLGKGNPGLMGPSVMSDWPWC